MNLSLHHFRLGTLLVNGIATSCYVKHHNTYNEMHTLLYPFRLYYYLMKNIFHLTDEPYPAEMRVGTGNKDEFYGTTLIKSLHERKKIIKYVVQDLFLNAVLNIQKKASSAFATILYFNKN